MLWQWEKTETYNTGINPPGYASHGFVNGISILLPVKMNWGISEHPFWGYRRIWAHLRYRQQLTINQKRVYRLMRENKLLASRKNTTRALRAPKSKPRADALSQFWGTDMTKIYIEGTGWAYITVVLDWFTKKIVGLNVGSASRAQEWLCALNIGLNRQFPQGNRGQNLKLISDNGCQPAVKSYQEACAALGIEQIYTSYNNPKGNADTERLMRTLKEELLWLHDWQSLDHLTSAVEGWVTTYNRD